MSYPPANKWIKFSNDNDIKDLVKFQFVSKYL